jgi:MFS family permease
MTHEQKMQRNVRLYLTIQPLLGLLFTIPVWVAFQQRFLSYTGMSVLESGAFLLGILFELPSGVMADLIGRKRTMTFGWFFIAAGYIVEGFSFTLPIMLLGFALVAIGGSFVSGADEALFYDSLKELKRENEYIKLNARINLLYRTSMIFAIFAGGFLYNIYFGLPYILRGIGVIAAIILALFMTEPYVDSEKFSAKSYLNKLKSGVNALRSSKYVSWLTLYYVVMASVSWSCLYYFNNPFAADVGYSNIGQSYLFTLIYIITTAMLLFITNRRKYLHKKLVFIVYPIILILGLVPGIFAGKLLAGILLGFIILAGGARFSILNGFVNEEIESEHRATALSALGLLVNLLCAVIIASLGPIQKAFGTQTVFSILGLIVVILGIPATYKVVKYQKEIQ